MDSVFILLALSYAVSLVLLLSIPLRRRAVLLRAGKRILPLPTRKRSVFKTFGILFLCCLIIFATQMRAFSFFVNIAFCGTALLGVEFAARQFALISLGGAYQNAVIADTETLLYDEIEVLPVLQLPVEEQANYAKNVLVAQTKSRGTVQLIFESPEVCSAVLEVLFTERPELRP